ncbi:hypothetical protein BpHYR1_031329 [Brachionus plicatilis]|uniref:Uncharacterized protein n=1 Tax=Brachionus plicatilis TaxID=10195 RepID=A0A3M7QSL5_BRAPC|nr:hypothetical protein BpHYR1_031329 [Brachionus plicatilis]
MTKKCAINFEHRNLAPLHNSNKDFQIKIRSDYDSRCREFLKFVENFKNFGLIDLTCIEKLQKTIFSIGLIPSFSSGLIIDQKFKINLNTNIISNYLTIKLANLRGFELNEDIFNVKIKNKPIDQYISLMNLYNSKNFQVFKSVSDFSIGLNRNVLDKNDSVYFNIEELSLELYGGELSERVIDKIVFQKLKSIKISGQVDKIESDAFDFADGSYYLSNVNIKSKNLNILLMNSMDWLEKLYFILDIKKVSWIFIIPDLYQFPSQDFCLFRKFPKINNFKIQFSEYNLNCSCTIFWLMRGRLTKDPQDNYVKILCDNIEDMRKCDIESLMSLCNNKSVMTKNNFKNDYIDLMEKSKIMKLFSISLLPIFGILGIVTNIMNMIVLNFKKNPEIAKEFNKPLFRFMFYNSFLNFLYCSISLMHMSNVCLSFTSFLCSPIYVVDFLGNIVKTSSNITNIAISLNRYILLEKSPVKNTFENTINMESMYVLKEANNSNSDNYIFVILFIINFVSNDLVLLGLLFVTDFMLLTKYRKKIV